MSGVIGVLAAMSLFLWFSAYIEARHLGPVGDAEARRTAPEVAVEVAPAAIEAPVTVAIVADPVISAA